VRVSRRGRAAAVLAASAALSGCSFLGIGGHITLPSISLSVFHLRAGMCFNPPATIAAQVTTLKIVPCRDPHTEEVYDTKSAYPAANGAAYPGAQKLEDVANGMCLEAFAGYVGVEYQHSWLFYTYLLPSVRSWSTDDDRQIVCILTTTGAKLTRSMKHAGPKFAGTNA
jgi:hypothetical protein